MMTTYKNDNSIAMIFNILWSIRKARNDLIFHRKLITPLQVLHASHALLNIGQMELLNQGGSALSRAVVSDPKSLAAFDINRISNFPNIYTDAT
jgi:hypothetical protein